MKNESNLKTNEAGVLATPKRPSIDDYSTAISSQHDDKDYQKYYHDLERHIDELEIIFNLTNKTMTSIQQVSIVIGQGAKTYTIGDFVHGKKLHSIVKKKLFFQGDPFDHYIGRSEKLEILFTVNCICPCDVSYLVS